MKILCVGYSEVTELSTKPRRHVVGIRLSTKGSECRNLWGKLHQGFADGVFLLTKFHAWQFVGFLKFYHVTFYCKLFDTEWQRQQPDIERHQCLVLPISYNPDHRGSWQRFYIFGQIKRWGILIKEETERRGNKICVLRKKESMKVQRDQTGRNNSRVKFTRQRTPLSVALRQVLNWGDWKRETWHRQTIKIVATDIATLDNAAPYRKGGHRETCFSVRVDAHYKFMFDSGSIIWAAHRFYVCSSISFCFSYSYVRQTKLASSLDNVWAHYKIVLDSVIDW